jgi:hypothetical protein
LTATFAAQSLKSAVKIVVSREKNLSFAMILSGSGNLLIWLAHLHKDRLIEPFQMRDQLFA